MQTMTDVEAERDAVQKNLKDDEQKIDGKYVFHFLFAYCMCLCKEDFLFDTVRLYQSVSIIVVNISNLLFVYQFQRRMSRK